MSKIPNPKMQIFSNVDTYQPRDPLDSIRTRLDRLNHSKISHDNIYHDNFNVNGKWTFNQDPNIGVESLDTVVTTAQNLSTRNYRNFGRKWNQMTSPTNNTFYLWSAVDVKGQYQAVCVYGGDIYISSNYGEDFIGQKHVGLWVSVVISSDGSTIIASKANGHYIYSLNSGATFSDLNPAPNGETNFTSVTLAMSDDGTVVVMVGTGSTPNVHINNDFKNNPTNNWIVTTTGEYNLVSSSAVAISSDGTNIYIGGKDGNIYYTTNNHEALAVIRLATPISPAMISYTPVLPAILNIVFFDNVFFIVTTSNSSVNGGNNVYTSNTGLIDRTVLTGQYIEGANSASMSMNGSTVFLACDNNPCMISRDSGVTFTPMQVFPEMNLNTNRKYFFGSSNNGYVTVFTTVGLFYRSIDNGLNFTMNSSVYDNLSFYQNIIPQPQAKFVNSGNNFVRIRNSIGFMVTFSNLFITSNNGLIWKYHSGFANLGNLGLYNGMQASDISDNGLVQVISGQNYVILSNDGGNNWSVIKQDLNNYIGVKISTDGQRIIVATPNGLYLSTSQGSTWFNIPITIPSGYSIVSISGNYIVSTIAIAVVNSTDTSILIYKTTDGNTYLHTDTFSIAGICNVITAGPLNSFYFNINTDLYSATGSYDFGKIQTIDESNIVTISATYNKILVSTSEGTYYGTYTTSWSFNPVPQSNTGLIDPTTVAFIDANNVDFFVVDKEGRFCLSPIVVNVVSPTSFTNDTLVNQFTSQWSMPANFKMSSSGQYQLFISPFGGAISTDWGKTSTATQDLQLLNLTSCAVSATGKYMYVTVSVNNRKDPPTLSSFYYSTNNGINWTENVNFPLDIISLSCACSANGKFVSVIDMVGDVYCSTDFGKTFKINNLNGLLTGTISYFLINPSIPDKSQPFTPNDILMSDNGRIQRVIAIEGIIIGSNDGGRSWSVMGKLPNLFCFYAAMSGSGKFLTLCCSTAPTDALSLHLESLGVFDNDSTFESSDLSLITSDNGGRTFSKCKGIDSFDNVVYNIAMSNNGQYQISLGQGVVYTSTDYGANFVSNPTPQILDFANNVVVNDEGSIIRIVTMGGNIFECRPYEQPDNISQYEVSPVMTSSFPIQSDRDAVDAYDLYIVDTTNIGITVTLPEIAILYPRKTRAIKIINIGNRNVISIVCNMNDTIISPSGPVSFIESNSYQMVEFISDGNNRWMTILGF